MPYHALSTARIALACKVHPNTVRLYERWGFLGEVQRKANGYRLFTQTHLQRMQLARIVMGAPWCGREIRRSGIRTIRLAAAGDLVGALDQGHHHLAVVRAERIQADAAADALERWVKFSPNTAESITPLSITPAAALLHVGVDALRNWERNGLLCVTRNPVNGYRRYGQKEIDRARVIRMLLNSGFSMMAVLRMLSQLDQDRDANLRAALDVPAPGEDVFSAADRWLSALDEQEQRAVKMIALIKEMV